MGGGEGTEGGVKDVLKAVFKEVLEGSICDGAGICDGEGSNKGAVSPVVLLGRRDGLDPSWRYPTTHFEG